MNHRSLIGRTKGRSTRYKSQCTAPLHLFPPQQWCSLQPSPASRPGDYQHLTLIISLWLTLGLYLFLKCWTSSNTRVSSEGKTNSKEIPEQSAPRTGSAYFWKWCLETGWKLGTSNQKCNQAWPLSQGQTSHGPQGWHLSLLTLISPFAKPPKVACSSVSCIKLRKSDR